MPTIPGKTPGQFFVPGAGYIDLRRYREDAIYDNATLSSSVTITDGTEYEFFTDPSGKNLNDTNLRNPSQLPESWEMYIMRMGMTLPPDIDKVDAIAIAENTFLRFETGNNNTRRRAPTWAWPTGFSMWGTHSIDYQTSSMTKNVTNIGNPTPAAVKDLLLAIHIPNRLNFRAVLRFEEDVDLSNDVDVWFLLYGYLSRPIQ